MSKLYLSPEQVALDQVSKILKIELEPYMMDRCLCLEISEDSIIKILSKVASVFNEQFYGDTGKRDRMSQVDKIIVKVGDHTFSAKEEFRQQTVSNGFKKV